MDVGDAHFYGADDDAAAGCDEEKGARVSERRPGRQRPDPDRAGRADRVALRLRAGVVAKRVDAEGRQTQTRAGANVWAGRDEGAGEVLGGVACAVREAARTDAGRVGADAPPRRRARAQ